MWTEANGRSVLVMPGLDPRIHAASMQHGLPGQGPAMAKKEYALSSILLRQVWSCPESMRKNNSYR
jgi:hypothetical protein